MTQKPPKFTGTVDLDDEDAIADHGDGYAAAAEPAMHTADTEADLGPDDYEVGDDELEFDGEQERQKRRAKAIYYGVIAVIVLVFGFVGYHQFAPMFQHKASPSIAVKAPPATQPAAKMADNANTLPPPPAGAGGLGTNSGTSLVSGMAAIPGAPIPGSNPAGLPMPGQPGAMPPPGPVQPGIAGQNAAQVGGPPIGGITAPPSQLANTASGAPAIGAPVPMAIAAPPSAVTAAPPPMPAPAPSNNPQLPAVPVAAKPAALTPPGAPTGTPSTGMITANVPTGPALPAAPATQPSAPATPVPVPAPVKAAATPATGVVTGSDPRVDDLASKVAGLQASQKVTATQLQQIQASLDTLSKQLGQVSVTPTRGATPAPVAATRAAATPRHVHHETASAEAAPSPGGHAAAGSWVLRSATPSGALLGHSSTGELQRVAVGDVVNGLGRITYIGEKNGRWVVQGVNGSVEE